MPKLFASSIDSKFSNYLDPIVEHKLGVVLSQMYMLGIVELNNAAQQTITIPALDSLKLDVWPIGAYAHFFNTGGVACQFVSASGVVINGVASAIAFDTSGYNTSVKLVRLGENKWLAELNEGSGGGGGGVFSGALVEIDAPEQSVPTSTSTDIDWGVEVYDTDGWHEGATNPSRLTVPADVTKVQLRAQIAFANSVTGVFSMRILKNGTTGYSGYTIIDWIPVTGLVNEKEIAQLISPPLVVVPGDYFTINTRQSSGGALLLAPANQKLNWFSIEKVA